MKSATFQNRKWELDQLCLDTDEAILLNIYGEGGIGKSSLLREAEQRLHTENSPTLVLFVDFRELQTSQPEALLRAIIAQAPDQLSVTGQNVEQVAGQIVAQLSILTEHKRVYLMFDTTELFQEEMDFWRWLETNLIGPLAVEGRVRQIFAGRVPAPWRRVEVRRILKLLPLEPLATDYAARDFVREVLQKNNPKLKGTEKDKAKVEKAVTLVLEFSFGHPLLSEKLAAYIAIHWPAAVSDKYQFKVDLCREIVKPFIEQVFFGEIKPPWIEILWWISVLDWFDATILQRYLALVEPELTKDQPDYFFIQGISRLRLHYTIIWREERGDRLHGVAGKIVRHCLEVLEPERYRRAYQAAAKTLEALAGEFPKEYPEFEQYRLEAAAYRQRVKQEAQP